MPDYQAEIEELNRRKAELERQAAESVSAEEKQRRSFIAGVEKRLAGVNLHGTNIGEVCRVVLACIAEKEGDNGSEPADQPAKTELRGGLDK